MDKRRDFAHTGMLRAVLIGVGLCLQVGIPLVAALWFSRYFVYFYVGGCILAGMVMLYIVNADQNPAYKIAWLAPVLLLPVFGSLFYFLYGKIWLSAKERQRLQRLDVQYRRCLRSAAGKAVSVEETALPHCRYLETASGVPPFSAGAATFLASGEKMYQRMLQELAAAQSFIFMEFFIIEEGKMWTPMLQILEEKAASGVDVRIIYDDYGSLFSLPANYRQILAAKGIRCQAYNRFTWRHAFRFNTRDHRKICVVDGRQGFVGGINLADEYINLKKVHDHWHDCGLLLQGPPVAALSGMFLAMWSLISGEIEDFQPYIKAAAQWQGESDGGLYQPYADSPLDGERVGENVYLNLLQRARRYAYISTPFLVIDEELILALTNAAKSGVDVRIITPRTGAWAMLQISRSYYPRLLRDGVKIYEYQPGYIHSKTYVCDDRFAVVGSINMDYRSLYLSHENAVWLADGPAVADIRDDYWDLLRQSRQIHLQDCRHIPGYRRLMQAILRLFAPLA